MAQRQLSQPQPPRGSKYKYRSRYARRSPWPTTAAAFELRVVQRRKRWRVGMRLGMRARAALVPPPGSRRRADVAADEVLTTPYLLPFLLIAFLDPRFLLGHTVSHSRSYASAGTDYDTTTSLRLIFPPTCRESSAFTSFLPIR
ncbi:hypothetical protein EDB83DRAFT_2532494 [Lactarius deliciosus]|nr:hypothetical protein EDB83DRAFT_2532494 [Lactarius deliciosus]